MIGSPGGDFGWRDDIRLRDKAAMMGEWTLKETWDLITDHGLAADPRDVMVNVEDDDEEAGMSASA